MKVKTANFLTSSANYKQCPPPKRPEIAFIGRSNVGKSSLINMLTDRKQLAKISGRPGKTQLINHFEINESWYLVDLPGYGYAQVSQKKRLSWQKMITDYLLNRENLALLNILVDSRIDPQPIDIEFITWAGENLLPVAIILTKADKLSKNKQQASKAAWVRQLKHMWEEMPPLMISSSETKEGQDQILELIDMAVENYTQQ
ncbi:MAG: ribosome biogenesis GTP-binding protein YihA/YsxC [Candidatus Cyclobacteriaceae bacterium M2_1C_046]